MDLIKSKKGIMDQLSGLVIGLVALGIIIVVALLIMGSIAANTTVAANANATKAIADTIEATDDVPGWLPIIVITLIGALLIGLVAMFRGRR